MPAGRPSLYDPAFCERVIELGKQGMSPHEMGLEMGFARSTLVKWTDEHPEFSAAFNEAQQFAQAWWEKQGRIQLENRDFNAGLWKQNMAPRFRADWTDKQVTENTTNLSVTGLSPEAEALLLGGVRK